jgi:rubrerythrin
MDGTTMTEHSIKDAIQTAIQMEKDGYAFYQKAAAQTTSDMGRTIFESLSADELLHLEVFQKMWKNTIGSQEWDALLNTNKKYQKLPIFPKDLTSVEGQKPNVNELDALRIAMVAEQQAIEYYTKIHEQLQDQQAKKIINQIIEQEKKHYFLLQEEFTHLSSTGYWYELDFLGG